MCRSPVAVAQSSSSSVALRHVLLVLWMTSRLAVVGRMMTSGVATLGRSLMSVNALLSFVVVELRACLDLEPLCIAAM